MTEKEALTARLGALWNRLVEPHASFTGDARIRARTLTTCLLLTVVTFIIHLVIISLSGVTGLAVILAILVMSGCYALSRTRHSRMSGIVAVSFLLIIPVLKVVADQPTNSLTSIFGFECLFVALLLSPLIFPRWVSAIIAVTTFVSIFLGVLVLPGLRVSGVLFGAMLVFSLIAIMLITTVIRNGEQAKKASAREALEKSELRYRMFSQLTNDFIYSARVYPEENFRYDIDWVVGEVEGIVGIPRGDIGTIQWPSIIHPDDFDGWMLEMMRVLKGEEVAGEFRILTPKGETRWVRSVRYSEPLEGSSSARRLHSAIQDITKRKIAEAALLESEGRYRKLAELASDFVFKLQLKPNDTFIVDWIAGPGTITAGAQGWTLPENWQDVIYPEDLPLLQAIPGRIRREGRVVAEFRIPGKSSLPRWFRVHLDGEADPNAPGDFILYGTMQNITERRTQEQALIESEARLRAIMDANVVAMVIVRVSTNRVYFVNAAACRLFGCYMHEMVGHALTDFYWNEADHLLLAKLSEHQGHVQDHEVQMRRGNGESVWTSATMRKTSIDGEAMLVYGYSDISERRAAEAALREQQAQFEGLVNSINGVVWETDIATRNNLFISQRVEELLGYSVARFLEEPQLWRNLIHPDDYLAATSESDHAILERRSFEAEYRMIAADGRIVWVHDSVRLVEAADGTPLTMRGLSVNITASKEAQLAEQAQRRMADALRQTAAIISETLDFEEVLDRVFEQLDKVLPSQAADIMLIEGATAQVVRGRGFDQDLETQVKAVRVPIMETPNFRRMVETGQPNIVFDTHSDPNWVNLAVSNWIRSTVGVPIRLEQQTIGFLNLTSKRPNAFTVEQAYYLQAFADQIAIAVRNARLYDQVSRYAEQLETVVDARTAELDFERRRIQAMFDAAGEGILYAEGETIRYVNPSLCALTGYSEVMLIGEPVTCLIKDQPPEQSSRLAEAFNKAQQERVWRGEMYLRRRDGSMFDAGLTIALVDEQGDTAYVPAPDARTVTVVRDISLEKSLQAQKSNLVSYASHELRTPLTNLKTRLYLLGRRPENLPEHLQILEEVTDRMQRLVEDLLDMTRLEQGIILLHRRPLDVQQLIEHIVQLQQHEAARKGLHITLHLPETPLTILGDEERLTQVITNLITNAINYTAEAGEITVSVAEAADLSHAGEHMVDIEVRDTGIGIASEHLANIFLPFFRVPTTVKGTGLGLSIAKEIVELHGGTMQVTSQLGVGSAFTVRLVLLSEPVTIGAL